MRIAVASGKGGTGKTFVATNLFNVLSRRGDRVTLTDCDAEAPNDLLFFRTEKVSVKEVTHRVPVINKDVCTGVDGAVNGAVSMLFFCTQCKSD